MQHPSGKYTDIPTKLSNIDRIVLARNLAAQVIFQALETGAFNDDLAMFSKDDQARIVAQLRLLARQYDASGLSEEHSKSKIKKAKKKA